MSFLDDLFGNKIGLRKIAHLAHRQSHPSVERQEVGGDTRWARQFSKVR